MNFTTAHSFAPGIDFAPEAAHPTLDHWLEELSLVGVGEAADLWRTYSKLMGAEAHAWLDAVGGLTMEKVQMEIELLVMANSAPNDLLFGLAHGKLTDAIGYRSAIRTPAHHVALTMGARTPVHNMLYSRVLNRGHQLALAEEKNSSDDLFDLIDEDDEMAALLGQSREDIYVLTDHLSQIKSPFMLGQLTSWILTNHRLNHPNQYAHVLSSTMMGGLSQDMLAEYCLASTTQMAAQAESEAELQADPS